MFHVGLNPYGINYAIGLMGAGTPRQNPRPLGLEGFVRIAEELGVRSIEIHAGHLIGSGSFDLQSLAKRLAAMKVIPVVSLGPPMEGLDRAIVCAREIGAKTVRVGLTTVLCGDRALSGDEWPKLVAGVRRSLKSHAHQAAEEGITLAIENHQDFGSQELLNFCEEAGLSVGICLDTGNALAVGEDPVTFARQVGPKVCHVHLKDYQAQWTDDGYRLIRCAIGDGAVPLAEIVGILIRHHPEMTASLEPGALEARHIRLFRPEWWRGYSPRQADELGLCLLAARRRRWPEEVDWRTPWESGADAPDIVDYEMKMLWKSVKNMKVLGLM
jgi:3-oxoisoapionate decarboxylase